MKSIAPQKVAAHWRSGAPAALEPTGQPICMPPIAVQHHTPFHVGDHVVVRHWGPGTVVECPHQDRYSGRVEVRYDDDGTTYHCFPSKLRPSPLPSPQLAAQANSPADAASLAPLAEPVKASSPATAQEQHEPFHVGEHVWVNDYGHAIVVDLKHHGGRRYEVRYGDGSTYHCYPSQLCHLPCDEASATCAHPTGETGAAPEAAAENHPAFIRIGERVEVKGYGVATIVGTPSEGKYAGRVKVRYDDGSTYHCLPVELLPLLVGAPVPLAPETAQVAEPSAETLVTKHVTFHVGDKVLVKHFGIATVVSFPNEGEYIGRVKVLHPDGSTYHCKRKGLVQLSTDNRLPVSWL